MKTAKSSTKNESVEFDVEKIQRFTQTELETLSHGELPFCYQIGTDVLVGQCRVVKLDERTWRVFDHGQQIFDFFTRKDAIFYCIAIHRHQLTLAKEIRDSDALLNRLEFDAALYRLRYKASITNNDTWGQEFYSTKYTETMHRLENTKKHLKKNISLAMKCTNNDATKIIKKT